MEKTFTTFHYKYANLMFMELYKPYLRNGKSLIDFMLEYNQYFAVKLNDGKYPETDDIWLGLLCREALQLLIAHATEQFNLGTDIEAREFVAKLHILLLSAKPADEIARY